MPKSKKGGRKGWTTPEQYDWLQEQVEAYNNLKFEKRRLNMFWIQLYDSWFERWPNSSTEDIERQKLVCIVIQSGPELIRLPVIATKAVV
jgi:hypothetical protein